MSHATPTRTFLPFPPPSTITLFLSENSPLIAATPAVAAVALLLLSMLAIRSEAEASKQLKTPPSNTKKRLFHDLKPIFAPSFNIKPVFVLGVFSGVDSVADDDDDDVVECVVVWRSLRLLLLLLLVLSVLL